MRSRMIGTWRSCACPRSVMLASSLAARGPARAGSAGAPWFWWRRGADVLWSGSDLLVGGAGALWRGGSEPAVSGGRYLGAGPHPLPARDGGSRLGSGAAGGRHAGVREASVGAQKSPGITSSSVLGEALLRLLEVGVPRHAVPDLEPRAGTDDGDLAVEPRVLRRLAGMVKRPCLSGTSSEAPERKTRHVVPGRPARRGRLAHLLGHLDELVHGKDEQAALLSTGHDEARRPCGRGTSRAGTAGPCRRAGACAYRGTQVRHLPISTRRRPTAFLGAPPYSTFPHRQRPNRQCGTPLTRVFARQRGGAKWSRMPLSAPAST